MREAAVSQQNQISYVCGTSDKPLLYQTIGDALDSAIARWPDRDAIVVRHQNVRLTFKEFGAEVDRVARGLLALGIKRGERVGIWSPNNLEWVLVQFATARIGAILVNINPAYRTVELEYVLKKVGCRMLILAPAFKSSDYIGMVQSLVPENARAEGGWVECDKFPDLDFLVQLGQDDVPGFLRFAELQDAGTKVPADALEKVARELDPDQAINIQFTSGTTGQPKGATLTHFNIVNNGYFVGDAMELEPEDRVCIPVPLYHCFGMVMGVLTCITRGSAMIFPAEAFEPASVLEAVAAERCTALYGVATMFIAELEHPRFKEFDLSSLRTGIMAGGPCPIEIMKRVVSEMNMREVTICYGMTETSPVSFQSGVDDPLERRVGTVGRIHPHVQVKIVGANGEAVPRGTAGELLTRGYSVMKGYWGDAERTAESIDAAGWMHTGDLAVIDAEGYCNIVGRAKDMIIRGGENVYPREIEEYLYRHPKVLDVSVVGVADLKYGEAVCACIRVKDGERLSPEEITAFCQGQIAHYKVPRYVQFVDSFPMTVTGKIQKFLLQEQMERELNLVRQKTA